MAQSSTVDSSVRVELIAEMRRQEKRLEYGPWDDSKVATMSDDELRTRIERLSGYPASGDALSPGDALSFGACHSKVHF